MKGSNLTKLLLPHVDDRKGFLHSSEGHREGRYKITKQLCSPIGALYLWRQLVILFQGLAELRRNINLNMG